MHRWRFHDYFIQTSRSAPLRKVRVSKEGKLYKEYKFMDFLLYFPLINKEIVEKLPELANVPTKC